MPDIVFQNAGLLSFLLLFSLYQISGLNREVNNTNDMVNTVCNLSPPEKQAHPRWNQFLPMLCPVEVMYTGRGQWKPLTGFSVCLRGSYEKWRRKCRMLGKWQESCQGWEAWIVSANKNIISSFICPVILFESKRILTLLLVRKKGENCVFYIPLQFFSSWSLPTRNNRTARKDMYIPFCIQTEAPQREAGPRHNAMAQTPWQPSTLTWHQVH